MAFFFCVFAIAGGVGWDVAASSAFGAVGVAMVMWCLSVPAVAVRLDRTTGRLLFLIVLFGLGQLWLAGNTDDEVFAPFVACICVSALGLTGFWRRWVVWKPFPRQSTGEVLASTAGALLILTWAFAYVTALLHSNQVVAIENQPDRDSLWVFEGYYAWHLLDVIPVLKVPATLNLPAPVDVTDIWAGGILLLAYKVLIAVPVVGVITQLFAQRGDEAGENTMEDTVQHPAADS